MSSGEVVFFNALKAWHAFTHGGLLRPCSGSQARSRGASFCSNNLQSFLHLTFIFSGTVKETSPIHLDLFEVIKTAIAEDGEGGEMIEDGPEKEVEEDGRDDTKPPASDDVGDIAAHSLVSQAQALISRAIATVLSIPPWQQAVLAVMLLYLASRVLLRRRSDPSSHQIEELNRKIDDLTIEIREVKVLLETMLRQRGETISN